MRRKQAVWLVLGTLLFLAGCQNAAAVKQAAAPERDTLAVFAAASLQEALDEIGQTWDSPIEYNFDSSGTLKTQIEEGAVCDVFISASPKQIEELREAGKLEDNTVRNILTNSVVLAVPAGNPSGITGFEELARALEHGDVLVAIGNSDVPVGQYTRRIFDYLGLDETDLADRGELSYGSSVKEVTAQISAGSVDAGIIYATDAHSANLEVVARATGQMCGEVIYPGAVIRNAPHAAKAREFLDYLHHPDCEAVFEKIGFSLA